MGLSSECYISSGVNVNNAKLSGIMSHLVPESNHLLHCSEYGSHADVVMVNCHLKCIINALAPVIYIFTAISYLFINKVVFLSISVNLLLMVRNIDPIETADTCTFLLLTMSTLFKTTQLKDTCH